MHEFLTAAKAWIDGGALALASAAVASLVQGATPYLTALAVLGSLSLVALRWHDRIKYGYRGKE